MANKTISETARAEDNQLLEARKFLREKEVEQVYGLTTSYLRKQRHQGGGVPFYKAGKTVLYRRDDVESWLADRMKQSTGT